MRELSSSFAARLDSGVTTLCTCWRVIRRDGSVRGFTDHDCDLTIDGVVHAAMSGLESSAFEASLGFAIGGAEVSGALSAASISEAELANGAWDGARVEVRRVDWSHPEDALLLDVAVIGEVRRTETAFVAELRSLAHELDQERGRLFQSSCDADLGDARCRFAMSGPPFAGEHALLAGSGPMELRIPAQGYADDWWKGGRLEMIDGANAGAVRVVKAHRREGDVDCLTLWSALAAQPAPGDRIRLFAGCDKSFATCREKFGNGVNFRGFPHIPGNDRLMAYPTQGALMDGGSLLQ